MEEVMNGKETVKTTLTVCELTKEGEMSDNMDMPDPDYYPGMDPDDPLHHRKVAAALAIKEQKESAESWRCSGHVIYTCVHDSLIPTKGNEHAAGMDLRVNLFGEYQADGQVFKAEAFPALSEPLGKVVQFHRSLLVGCGVAVAIPDGYFGLVTIRSSIGWKFGVNLINTPGIIDSDYRGEVKLALVRNRTYDNNTQFPIAFEHGERVGQLLILPLANAPYHEMSLLPDTDRGHNGFGSTGRR